MARQNKEDGPVERRWNLIAVKRTRNDLKKKVEGAALVRLGQLKRMNRQRRMASTTRPPRFARISST